MKIKSVTVLNTEEIESITKDTITFSASEITHIKTIEEIANMLLKEVDAYKSATKDKLGHKDYEDTNVKLKVSDYMQFDGTRFQKEHPELHKLFKTKAVHKETVTYK